MANEIHIDISCKANEIHIEIPCMANGECLMFTTWGPASHSGNDFPTFYLIFSFFNSILPPALSPLTDGFIMTSVACRWPKCEQEYVLWA
jgi:hypothetical protein